MLFFVETMIHFFEYSLINRKLKKNRIYLKLNICINIINVLTVTFDLFNDSNPKHLKSVNSLILKYNIQYRIWII